MPILYLVKDSQQKHTMNLFPTQYSTLSATALNDRIKEAYNVGHISTKLLLRGVSDTYIVTEGSPKYVLKVYRNSHRSFSEIQGEVELLNTLSKNKAKVSYPISDIEGNYIQKFNTGEGPRYGILFSYAEGQASNDLTKDQIKIVGQEMAFNHNITSTIELKHDRPEYTITSTIHEPLDILKSAFSAYNFDTGYDYLQVVAEKTIRSFQLMDTHAFSHGYCHYDYLPKNFHFDEKDGFTLFDFDFAGKGYLVNDLMSFQVHYFFAILYGGMSKEDSADCMKLFISAYREKREISDEELAAIPCLGIMFWIFYLAIQYNGYDDFSNNYFNQTYLKKWVNWIEQWETLYCKF